MKTDYFILGFKNLRHRGLRSWLTLLGIFIGIAAVVSLISLGNGLKVAVNSQFGTSIEVISIQAGGITGFGPPGGVVNPLTKDDVEAIDKIAGVEIAIARNVETVRTEFNNKLHIGFAFSIPDGKARKEAYDMQHIEVSSGRLLNDGDNNKVLLGNNFGEKDNVFEKKISPGDNIKIEDKNFKVVGILERKGSFILDNAIAMNDNVLESLTGYGDEVDVILVKVIDKDEIDKVAEEIEKLLRERRNVKEGQEDFEVSTPEATLEQVNQILSGIQAFIVIIASISIIVGAVGIINTMTTSVLERTRDIGIMKSVGARNADIFFQFLFEAGLLGFVGGLLGVLVGAGIGIGGTLAINSLIGADTVPSIDVLLILFALIGSFIVGSISGIIPALNAAKQDPVEALRK
ncbi:MAG: ABC transporter permease [Candidatus Nanoarchaeia archaeon]